MPLWSLGSDRLGRRRLIALLGLSAALILVAALAVVPRNAAIRTSVAQPDRPGLQVALGSPPAHASRAMQLLALGDSVASGAGCGCLPFATLLAKKLASATGHAVPMANAAQDGLTTSGLLDQLRRSDLDESLAAATLVTVTIGANDFDPDLAGRPDCLGAAIQSCVRAGLTSLGSELAAALDQIQVLAPRSQVLVTGYWNVFLDGDVGRQHGDTYVQISDALTRTVNAVIAEQARGVGATYVDLYAPFEQRPLPALTALLAPDGDHPSASGHELISDVLLDAIQSTTTAGRQ